jgi:hypothetical protein
MVIHSIRKGFIAVPVVDDDDGYTYWDVHTDVVDWSSEDPIVTGSTLVEARTLLAEWVRSERRVAGLVRFGR